MKEILALFLFFIPLLFVESLGWWTLAFVIPAAIWLIKYGRKETGHEYT